MDKETLSNYGWIVICVLVLAVMLALATPFGNFISTAVKSTTQGLFDTNKNALNSTGLINIGDQSFSDGTGGSDGGNQTTEVKREAGSVIPDGATYTPNGGTALIGNGTNKFPDVPAKGDTYEEGDYVYTYNKGIDGNTSIDYGSEWSVKVKDKTKTKYGEILSEIAGKPVTYMSITFSGCTSITTAPAIPNGVTNMYFTFSGCTSLTTAPAIPNSVTNMYGTFSECPLLTTAPVIPNSVTNMNSTFYRCTSLTTAPVIPNSVTNMEQTFVSCKSLTTAPTIPNSVTNMRNTFASCTSLTKAPAIPNSVKDIQGIFGRCTSLTKAPAIPNSITKMTSTFFGCTSLTTAPTIPNSVTDMTYTFKGCTSLTTAPAIPNSVKDMTSTFEGCTALTTVSTIPSSVRNIANTFNGCTSLTGTITINANNLINYSSCFKGTVESIILTGSSTRLTDIAATSKNGNVTVK